MVKVVKSELFAWVDTLFRFMPGKNGTVFRRFWYKNHFHDCNEISIGMGCNFISPQTMNFKGSVSIGERSLFSADGGSIVVGEKTSFNSNVHINASVGGKIKIGEKCLISPNVVMRTAGHRFEECYSAWWCPSRFRFCNWRWRSSSVRYSANGCCWGSAGKSN